MTITITDPELIRFVEEEVRSGRSASPAEAVAAAIDWFRQGEGRPATDDEIDDETAQRLTDAYGRAVRSEGGFTVEQARERLGRSAAAATGVGA